MTNPFEQEEGIYCVLMNDEGQYSLWPSYIAVPAGWTVVLENETRQACMKLISSRWTDLRPRSLREAAGAVNATSQG